MAVVVITARPIPMLPVITAPQCRHRGRAPDYAKKLSVWRARKRVSSVVCCRSADRRYLSFDLPFQAVSATLGRIV